tara:strand:- start:412 stop:804 length:393 start_codon:yes stop_codon:yes gene_type:complete
MQMTNKKKTKEILAAYDRQIRKDMGFCIKYRPSRWGDFLPSQFISPLLKFIQKKGGKNFLLKSALIFSLIFIGVIPTLNFIWSNIFRVWLILLFIPLVYWGLAITCVYTRVIVLAFCEFVGILLDKLIDL